MYHYAISFPDRRVTDPDWQQAISASAVRRIEFSCAACIYDARLLRQRVAVLEKMQQEGRVKVSSIHVPFGCYWNVAQVDEEGRRRAAALTREFFALTAPLGCRNYTLHPSAEPIAPEDRAMAMKQSRRSLEELAEDAQKGGFSINVEDLPRTCLGRNAEEMEELLSGLPETAFGYCLDVNHFCGTPEACPAIIDRLGARIRAFHLSDYDGVDECHWYPGLGALDWPAVMAAVRRLPGDVELILETYGFVKAPSWKERPVSDRFACRNALKCVAYLERAAEIEAGLQTLAEAGKESFLSLQ